MIAIEVRLYAGLLQYSHVTGIGGPLQLQVPAGTSLAELLNILSVPASEVKIIFVNHHQRDQTYLLQDGDRVALFPPVAGG